MQTETGASDGVAILTDTGEPVFSARAGLTALTSTGQFVLYAGQQTAPYPYPTAAVTAKVRDGQVTARTRDGRATVRER